MKRLFIVVYFNIDDDACFCTININHRFAAATNDAAMDNRAYDLVMQKCIVLLKMSPTDSVAMQRLTRRRTLACIG
jgi:hypothetical protein